MIRSMLVSQLESKACLRSDAVNATIPCERHDLLRSFGCKQAQNSYVTHLTRWRSTTRPFESIVSDCKTYSREVGFMKWFPIAFLTDSVCTLKLAKNQHVTAVPL